MSCAIGEKEDLDNKETCLDTSDDVQTEVKYNKVIKAKALSLVMNLLDFGNLSHLRQLRTKVT